jgi:hypothetical protein
MPHPQLSHVRRRLQGVAQDIDDHRHMSHPHGFRTNPGNRIAIMGRLIPHQTVSPDHVGSDTARSNVMLKGDACPRQLRGSR